MTVFFYIDADNGSTVWYRYQFNPYCNTQPYSNHIVQKEAVLTLKIGDMQSGPPHPQPTPHTHHPPTPPKHTAYYYCLHSNHVQWWQQWWLPRNLVLLFYIDLQVMHLVGENKPRASKPIYKHCVPQTLWLYVTSPWHSYDTPMGCSE